MTIAVHRVTEADCAQLAAMHCQCFAEGWSSDSFFALLTSGQVFGFVGKGLDAPEWESFGIGRVAADEAEILTLGTLPSHRGQGLASKLLTAIMDEAIRQGASRLFLEVGEANEAALRLYRRAGFSVIGRRRAYYPDQANALMLSVTLPGGRDAT